MKKTTHYYVFVRQDIPVANQIVQVSHAMETRHYTETHNCVLIGVPDESSLLEVSAKLEDIDHEMFWEPDFPIGYSALVTRPVTTKERALFSEYNIYREENNIPKKSLFSTIIKRCFY